MSVIRYGSISCQKQKSGLYFTVVILSRQIVAFQHFNLIIVHLAGTTDVCRCDLLAHRDFVQNVAAVSVPLR